MTGRTQKMGALLVGAAFTGLLAYTCLLAREVNRLEARVSTLERSLAERPVPPRHVYDSGLELRVSRLERDLAPLEHAMEKQIVRRGLDEKLNHVMDTPPGF